MWMKKDRFLTRRILLSSVIAMRKNMKQWRNRKNRKIDHSYVDLMRRNYRELKLIITKERKPSSFKSTAQIILILV
jgi:hypothetical protein